MFRWRWSSISVSVRSRLRAALALLVVGNVAFVIAQVSVTLLGGVPGECPGVGKGMGTSVVPMGDGDAASGTAHCPQGVGHTGGGGCVGSS